ncbi:MAG TPA: hypothetical protein VHJ99_14850 [Candidatus Dormibacteraeota bacterium]|nr:hypothetical protein [Candidatus Dormibacteraeota bacterium]
MSSSRLALDLSGGTLRVLDGMPGSRMRCGEAAAPAGAMEGGRVVDSAALGQALRLLLARSDITANRALIAASDVIASFKVLNFPRGTSDSEIDTSVRAQLNLGSERMAMRHIEVLSGGEERTIFATVWDRSQVHAIAAAVKHAGLDPVAVDLKSLCVARAIPVGSCILLDLSADPCEAVLIDDRVPRAAHSFRVESGGDLALALANGLRPVLAFQRRSTGTGFGPDSPILVRSDQVLPSLLTDRLEQLSGHPVAPLPRPPRVDPEVRFGPYLTCIGLVMRRRV